MLLYQVNIKYFFHLYLNIPYNNHIDNLRTLCPNCHSQTKTYGSLNKKQKSRAEKRDEYMNNPYQYHNTKEKGDSNGKESGPP